jgi:FKBP-type peptidyl-prolyl cis-trans isomerase FklB
MKTSLSSLSTLVLSSSLLLGLVACNKAEPTKEMSEPAAASEPTPSTKKVYDSGPTLETLDQKVSYGIGRNIGGELSRDANLEVDINALIAGLRSAANGEEGALNDQELQAAFAEIRTRAEEAARALIVAEQAKAVEYLEANKARDGVSVTETGLQYEVLIAGDGPKPQPTDRVSVHYHGTLTDGTVFDSSVERGDPAQFGVTQVIPGWVEGLQLMPVGSKWKFHIPPALAYGDRGQGSIPGGAALVFEVELLDIVTPEPTAAPAVEAP